jgi:hypothetical protein
MKPSEIITQVAQQHGVDPKGLASGVYNSLKTKNTLLLQKNDSLMVITMFKPKLAEVHLFTVEKGLALAKSLKEFMQELKNEKHIDRIYVKVDNDKIIPFAKSIGVNFVKSDLPQFQYMADE